MCTHIQIKRDMKCTGQSFLDMSVEYKYVSHDGIIVVDPGGHTRFCPNIDSNANLSETCVYEVNHEDWSSRHSFIMPLWCRFRGSSGKFV